MEQATPADLHPDVAKSVNVRILVVETPIVFGSLRGPTTIVEHFLDNYDTQIVELVARYTTRTSIGEVLHWI